MENEVINPVFIVGTPRSGTSLLRILLNSHPDIGLCDETYYLYYVFHRQRTFGNLENPVNRRFAIDKYLETTRAQRLKLDMDSLRDTLYREGTNYSKLMISLMRFYAHAHEKKLYGEKTPQHALEAKLLCRLFPDCRLIHLVRDPRDVVASLMRMPWGSRSISANARLWVQCVSAAEKCRDQKNFLRIKYELLAGNPAAALQEICSFLDVPYNSEMLTAKSEDEADRWWFRRAREPVSSGRVEKWRDDLTMKQVSIIEWIAGETMRSLGYECFGSLPGPASRTTAMTGEIATALTSRITSLPRLWYHWFQPAQLATEEAWIDRKVRKDD